MSFSGQYFLFSAASAGQWCVTCVFSTADCKSLATKPAVEWKTTIDLPRMNLIIFPTSASPTSLIVVFHCSACLLQDFCNLLYPPAVFTQSAPSGFTPSGFSKMLVLT